MSIILINTVTDVEARGESCGVNTNFIKISMPPGVDYQCGGTVGHIEMDVEVLVDTFEHIHRLTCSEQASTVRVNRITDNLLKHRLVT